MLASTLESQRIYFEEEQNLITEQHKGRKQELRQKQKKLDQLILNEQTNIENKAKSIEDLDESFQNKKNEMKLKLESLLRIKSETKTLNDQIKLIEDNVQEKISMIKEELLQEDDKIANLK